jgi:hypothetical protein
LCHGLDGFDNDLDVPAAHRHCLGRALGGGAAELLVEEGLAVTCDNSAGYEMFMVKPWIAKMVTPFSLLAVEDPPGLEGRWRCIFAGRDPQARALILDDPEAALAVLEGIE